MILDRTADLIAKEGLSGLSMERISRHAEISKSLVYNYFDSVPELLKELLDRELHSLRRMQLDAARQANTFEELVRSITRVYLRYIDERGLIIERLQSDPNISAGHDPTAYGRTGAVEYLAPIVSRHFGIPLDLATAATDISFGLPAAAGEFLLRGTMDLQEVEELTATLIIGSFVKVRDDYLTRQKTLER